MKKLGLYFIGLLLVLSAILVLNIYNDNIEIGTKAQSSAAVNRDFVGDENYNIDEDIDIPKVVFVYSDPTEHHPQG